MGANQHQQYFGTLQEFLRSDVTQFHKSVHWSLPRNKKGAAWKYAKIKFDTREGEWRSPRTREQGRW